MIVVAGILIASLATVSYVIAKQPTRCERLEAGWDSREATIEESVELTGEYFEFCLDP